MIEMQSLILCAYIGIVAILIFHADKTAGYYAQRGDLWVDAEHFLPMAQTPESGSP